MTDQVDDRPPHIAFKDGIEILQRDIVLRLRSLRRGLENEIQRCRDTNNAPDMARAYARFRNIWSENDDSVMKEAAGVGKLFTQLAEVIYPETLEFSGMQSVPLTDEDIKRVIGMQVRTKASVKSGLKEQAVAFLRADLTAIDALRDEDFNLAHDALVLGGRTEMAKEIKKTGYDLSSASRQKMIDQIEATTQNLEAIVVDHIFPQTLSSLAKDMASEGHELPEDIFTTYLQPTTTWRKITSKS